MRVKLNDYDRKILFSSLKTKLGNLNVASEKAGVSRRTLTDWQRGKFLMQAEVFEKLVQLAEISGKIAPQELVPDFWGRHESGRKGALARMKLYGNVGTPEGRRKGGLASMAAHVRNGNSRFTGLKTILEPEHSEKLAEFLGIMIGDGHLAEYQATMSTNSETDIQHANFVAQMMFDLFGVSATLNFKKDCRAVEVVASSKAMVDCLRGFGMPRGNKIHNGIAMPAWISKSGDYQKAFLRGLFDTDGCVYLDKHIIKGRLYKNLGWTITSYADTLRTDVSRSLRGFGFSPTCTVPQLSVFLRREKDIVRYFREIGTHNDKHRKRYERFLTE